MATKTIAWESGGGYITLTYTGIGNGSISVKSDANDSFDERQQTVRIVTTAGSPSRAVELLVKQKGKTLPAGTVYNFDYTGSVQQVTLPAGRYKLQCWGAQGGNSYSYSGIGSKGGYSEGVLTLTQTTTLYIFVGGKGSNGSSTSMVNGGWNGGGGSVGRSSYNSGDEYGISYPACGGGATDIATVTSGMSYSSYRTNRSNASLLSRCIVAGGGAGASARYTEESGTVTEWTNCASINTKMWANYSTKLWQSPFCSVPFNIGDVLRVNNLSPYGTDAQFVYKDANGSYHYASSSSLNYQYTVPSDCVSLYVYCIYRDSSITPSDETTPKNTTITVEKRETTTSTDTSSGSSTSSQQGGGTSGRGTSPAPRTVVAATSAQERIRQPPTTATPPVRAAAVGTAAAPPVPTHPPTTLTVPVAVRALSIQQPMQAIVRPAIQACSLTAELPRTVQPLSRHREEATRPGTAETAMHV